MLAELLRGEVCAARVEHEDCEGHGGLFFGVLFLRTAGVAADGLGSPHVDGEEREGLFNPWCREQELSRSVRVGGSLPRRCLKEVDKSRWRCDYREQDWCDEELSLRPRSEI